MAISGTLTPAMRPILTDHAPAQLTTILVLTIPFEVSTASTHFVPKSFVDVRIFYQKNFMYHFMHVSLTAAARYNDSY